MVRTVDEWRGRSDDHVPPPKVQLRIWERARGRCQICTRKLMGGDKWECDHIVPLADGGENREGNLQVACASCHRRKTSAENSERARVRSKAKAHAGIKTRKGPPMPGTKASGIKKCMNGDVVRRSRIWPGNGNPDSFDSSEGA
jgi:5-methylcytosine-specific restriction protein A